MRYRASSFECVRRRIDGLMDGWLCTFVPLHIFNTLEMRLSNKIYKIYTNIVYLSWIHDYLLAESYQVLLCYHTTVLGMTHLLGHIKIYK